MTLGAVAYPGGEGVEFVFMLAVAGILASIIGVMFARSSKSQNPQAALNSGTYIGGAIVIAAAAYLSNSLFGSLDAFWAIAAGLLVGMIIGKITEIYTSADFGSVKKIAQQSETGSGNHYYCRFGSWYVFYFLAYAFHLHRRNRILLCNGRRY